MYASTCTFIVSLDKASDMVVIAIGGLINSAYDHRMCSCLFMIYIMHVSFIMCLDIHNFFHAADLHTALVTTTFELSMLYFGAKQNIRSTYYNQIHGCT